MKAYTKDPTLPQAWAANTTAITRTAVRETGIKFFSSTTKMHDLSGQCSDIYPGLLSIVMLTKDLFIRLLFFYVNEIYFFSFLC